MKAVILVAGASRRLRPLTNDTPKCLLPLGGTPMLRRMMDGLIGNGIERFVVVTGYLEHTIREAIPAWYPELDVSYVTNPEYASTNTGVSLLLARPFVDGEPFLLLDGDIVSEPGVSAALLQSNFDNCLALRPTDDLSDEEVKVELDDASKVLRIGKPNVPLSVAAGESIGIEKLSSSFASRLFDAIAHRVHAHQGGNELREVAYQQIIDEGAAIYAVDVGHCYCAEIDTPEDLATVGRELAERGL